MKRVAAPERTRERLRALMDGRLGTAPDRSNLVLVAAQLILEEALEAEVRDEVGRERYERGDGEASGYRNGYRTGRMKTAEGVVEFAAPQVRDTAEPFVSGIRQNLAGRTGALEDLAADEGHLETFFSAVAVVLRNSVRGAVDDCQGFGGLLLR